MYSQLANTVCHTLVHPTRGAPTHATHTTHTHTHTHTHTQTHTHTTHTHTITPHIPHHTNSHNITHTHTTHTHHTQVRHVTQLSMRISDSSAVCDTYMVIFVYVTDCNTSIVAVMAWAEQGHSCACFVKFNGSSMQDMQVSFRELGHSGISAHTSSERQWVHTLTCMHECTHIHTHTHECTHIHMYTQHTLNTHDTHHTHNTHTHTTTHTHHHTHNTHHPKL